MPATMRKLLVLVIVLILLLVGVDVGARIVAEHLLEKRVDSYLTAPTAKITIAGFPFLLPLLTQGRIARITASATGVSHGTFVLDRVSVTVTGVRIDRSQAVDHQQLDIVGIGTGTVNADMTQADFDRLVGAPVTLGNGSAQVVVQGVPVTAQVAIVNGQLRLEAPGLPVSVPIPTLPVLPCLEQVQVVPGHLVGSCTFHQIPADFQKALQ
jgi:LmeA-like phospholipid-binding